ncbi:hypothetical protein [Nocardia flavorosea]|uniref:Uncharacterized protein n=1 Tax=Nocardia flavorosea TaxID=53429 RepID=A0A846YMX2_9NOCA|nr:hypothetical protein [Nocardia flavorosea]NKY61046.1 hypothetical protein [Nocardia flavorosea]
MPNDKLRSAPTIGIEIPHGYNEIPLGDLDALMQRVGPVITDSVPGQMRSDVPNVLGALHFMLATLAANNALYSGIGLHRTAESDIERIAVSWLTVSSFDYGEERNPRLVLSELIQTKAAANSQGKLAVVETPTVPILYFEWTRKHVAPDILSYPAADSTEVFQIEATVPSRDGTAIAVVEFSTADTEAGPQYRGMILDMAASVTFPEPPPDMGSSSLAL